MFWFLWLLKTYFLWNCFNWGRKRRNVARGRRGEKNGRENTYKYVFIYPNPNFQQITTHIFPILMTILKLVQILKKITIKAFFFFFYPQLKGFSFKNYLEQLCLWLETWDFPSQRFRSILISEKKRDTKTSRIIIFFFL